MHVDRMEHLGTYHILGKVDGVLLWRHKDLRGSFHLGSFGIGSCTQHSTDWKSMGDHMGLEVVEGGQAVVEILGLRWIAVTGQLGLGWYVHCFVPQQRLHIATELAEQHFVGIVRKLRFGVHRNRYKLVERRVLLADLDYLVAIRIAVDYKSCYRRCDLGGLKYSMKRIR